MFFISLYNFVNSLDLTLERNFKSYDNSFIDNFLDELKNRLAMTDAMEKFKKIPEDTLFTLDRYEGNYAVCENRSTGKMVDIPREKISPMAKDGDILRLRNASLEIDAEETKRVKKIMRDKL